MGTQSAVLVNVYLVVSNLYYFITYNLHYP